MTRAWRENLSGQTFGRLTVLREMPSDKAHRSWLCVCACGTEKVVGHPSLKSGRTQSCGCLRRELVAKKMTTHGACASRKPTRAYKIWAGMIARCEIKSASGYEQYGGKGVKVCDRWKSFENFLADMGEPPAGMSIDRLDGSRGYESGNCRWATRQQQNENRKSVRWIEFDGKRMNVAQWARHLGINKSTLLEALAKHPLEIALRDRGRN